MENFKILCSKWLNELAKNNTGGQAVELYSQAINLEPNNYNYHLNKSIALVETGNINQAASIVQKIYWEDDNQSPFDNPAAQKIIILRHLEENDLKNAKMEIICSLINEKLRKNENQIQFLQQILKIVDEK